MSDQAEPSESVTVVVADDQATIREALSAMLDLLPDIDVVASAANGQQAVDAVAAHEPDVLLTDLRMPVMDGATATALVCENHPATAVVLLTTYDDEESILSALQAGARGYLTKEAGRAEIAAAIRTAAAGQAVLDPAVQARLLAAATGARQADATTPSSATGACSSPDDSSPAAAQAVSSLTGRERDVLELIAAGLSNREIAQRLFISEATVKTHINNLFAKLDLRDRAHAMRFAFDHGLGG